MQHAVQLRQRLDAALGGFDSIQADIQALEDKVVEEVSGGCSQSGFVRLWTLWSDPLLSPPSTMEEY